MNRNILQLFLFGVALLFSSGALAEAPLQDVPGGKDHPLVSRYSGSILIGYKVAKFDEAELVLGPAFMCDGKWKFEKSLTIEGQRTRLLYLVPRDRSSLEMMRNYEEALAKAGFSTLYSCARGKCGDRMASAIYSRRFHFRPHRHQGDLNYNLSLSLQRAEAVVRALAEQGVDAWRMIAKGLANLAPLASNDPEQGRARNRRVELVVQ
jgi:hypothetical protein